MEYYDMDDNVDISSSYDINIINLINMHIDNYNDQMRNIHPGDFIADLVAEITFNTDLSMTDIESHIRNSRINTRMSVALTDYMSMYNYVAPENVIDDSNQIQFLSLVPNHIMYFLIFIQTYEEMQEYYVIN